MEIGWDTSADEGRGSFSEDHDPFEPKDVVKLLNQLRHNTFMEYPEYFVFNHFNFGEWGRGNCLLFS